jgi:hypothetical protein
LNAPHCPPKNDLGDPKATRHNQAVGHETGLSQVSAALLDFRLRIVRVACRTPASYQPFEEVEQSIREHMRHELQTKALEELYSRTSIETPYIDDALAVRQPPGCSVPAQSQTDAFAP